jgi:hypothetical protein
MLYKNKKTPDQIKVLDRPHYPRLQIVHIIVSIMYDESYTALIFCLLFLPICIHLQELVCNKWSKRCPKKIPLKNERVDHTFKEVSEKDLEIERMVANMRAMGLGGMSMYNREDMDDMTPEDFAADEYGGDDAYGGGAGMGDL